MKGLCLLLGVAAMGCDALADSVPQMDAGSSSIAQGAAGSFGAACEVQVKGPVGGSGPAPSVLAREVVKSESAPPPISGGTMLTTADGKLIVAADPERDQIYFVDAQNAKSLFTRKLNAGDQPGRVVEDAAGRIHVVLRAGHAIATLGREADSAITRRDVCAVPRGIAYDPAGDQLHIACAEGKLVTLTAAPTNVMPMRSLDVAADLRDVVVRGNKLFVSRFRSAELLVLDADGQLQETHSPASFAHDEMRKSLMGTRAADGSCSLSGGATELHIEETPDVAWRMIDVPKAGVTMLHQRAHVDEIQVSNGGYGAADSCGGGIVKTAITKGLDTTAAGTANIRDLALTVDMASDPDGQQLAVVAPGNRGGFTQVEVVQIRQLIEPVTLSADPNLASSSSGAAPTTAVAKPTAGSTSTGPGAPCSSGAPLPEPPGQATAVTFVSPNVIAVQQRDPAAISFYNVSAATLTSTVTLDMSSTFDTGHTMFHMRTSAGLACASCHPEAGDDGHVWTFASIGPRRTQTLRGGILGTEPLHWNGDMQDFSMLMTEVFVGRMSGFTPSADQTDALSHWVDKQPALHADVADETAAERGKVLFESTTVGCASCHSGTHLTNNTTQNVGTGANLQVPSLKGVRFRTPLMHNGCAANITERLTNAACGGGDQHGKTSQLSASQVQDLTAYLETL